MGNGVGVINDVILQISIGQADLERAGLLQLVGSFHRQNADQNGLITIEKCVNYLSKQLDVFITHDWGSNGGDHAFVSKINDELKGCNLRTWIDTEELYSDMKRSVTQAIDNSRVVLVCVTKRYNAKVVGLDGDDHCKIEFDYASKHRDPTKIVAVLLEPDLEGDDNWTVLKSTLRGSPVVDFSDSSNFDTKVKDLYHKIMEVLGGPDRNLATILERVDLNVLISNRDEAADTKLDPADELIRHEMVEWMRGSLKYPRKLADKYVVKLIQQGVGSEDQLLKRLQRTPKFLVQLGFDDSDAEDIQDALFAGLETGTETGSGGIRKSLKSVVAELSDTVTSLRAEVAGLDNLLKNATTEIAETKASAYKLQVQSGKQIVAITRLETQVESDGTAIYNIQTKQKVDEEAMKLLKMDLIDDRAFVTRLEQELRKDEDEMKLIRAEAAKEAAYCRNVELRVANNSSLVAELQAEIKHDEDVIVGIKEDAAATARRMVDLETRISHSSSKIEELQTQIDEDRVNLKVLREKAAAAVSSIARLETNAKEDRATLSRLDRETEEARVWDLFRSWSSPPCQDSRPILAEQLRKQKLVDGEVWTPQFITWEVHNEAFADPSKTFRISSPKRELLEGVQGCISVERAAPEGDIQCFIWLYGFRGFAEFSITLFRFDKGAPKHKSGRFTWEKDEGKGWANFIPQGKFSGGDYLTGEGKLRFLASFVFKR